MSLTNRARWTLSVPLRPVFFLGNLLKPTGVFFVRFGPK